MSAWFLYVTHFFEYEENGRPAESMNSEQREKILKIIELIDKRKQSTMAAHEMATSPPARSIHNKHKMTLQDIKSRLAEVLESDDQVQETAPAPAAGLAEIHIICGGRPHNENSAYYTLGFRPRDYTGLSWTGPARNAAAQSRMFNGYGYQTETKILDDQNEEERNV